MPGTNLTRDEAAQRAALVTVETYDVVLDLTTGARDLHDAEHHPLLRGAGRRRPSSTSSATRSSRSPSTARASTPPTQFAEAGSRLPGLAARQRGRRRARPGATRTPARACTASSTPSTARSTSTRSSRSPTAVACSPVFEQPDLKATFAFTVTAPAHWQVVSDLPHSRAERDVDAATAWPRDLGLRADAADLAATSPRSSPGRTTSCATRSPRRPGEVPLGIFCRAVAAPAPRRREHLRADQAGLRVLREGVRPPLPVREVRPDLHAGVQHGRDGERRVRHHHRGLRLPLQGARRRSSSAAR